MHAWRFCRWKKTDVKAKLSEMFPNISRGGPVGQLKPRLICAMRGNESDERTESENEGKDKAALKE